MDIVRRARHLPVPILVGAFFAASPALADHAPAAKSDTYVTWESAPCTEPVLMVEVDRENVRDHIPKHYPRSDEDFMSHVVTSPGIDGRPKATLVFTLNRCRDSTTVRVVNGNEQRPKPAVDVAEILVAVLWDGPSTSEFEFYALASYVSDSRLAGAFTSLGLPSQATPELVYELDADPEQPDPGAFVPLLVEVPGAFRFEGMVMRPLTYGPGGQATHHYDGPRGGVWVDHDAPGGGMSGSSATITVIGAKGDWLADLLGAESVFAQGLYLEKLDGHAHTAYLLE